jgi:uncharacterized membrane protein (UPF0127 family)
VSAPSTIVLSGLNVEVARSFSQRLVGLLGRRSLSTDSGLLITPCNNIHTAFMRFAIDVVFIDENAKVVAVCPNIGPFRVAMARRAKACLELCSGNAAALGIEVGQCLAPLLPALGDRR